MVITESVRSWGAFNTKVAIFFVAMMLWLLNHPLLGVSIHDARIYMVLALHWLSPDAFARDPFFMFGSQDSLSFFSSIYGPLIALFGLSTAAVTIVLTGAALWCVAAIALANSLMPRSWVAGMAVLAMASLSINYSPNAQTFVLNEAFATARSIAFPLGALALAYCIQGRLKWAIGFSLAACALHPLIGVWPLALTMLWILSWSQRALLIGTAMLIGCALMLAELGPFARFDAEWMQVLYTSTQDVFVAPPVLMRWQGHATQLAVLLVAALHFGGRSRQLYLLAALLSVLGLLVAMLASYFWPSQLVIQAQLWRSMWLAAYLMPVALCHLLMRILDQISATQRDGLSWWLLTLSSTAFMLRDAFLLMLLLWCISACFYLYVSSVRERLNYLFIRILPWGETRGFKSLAIGLLVVALPSFLAELTLLEGSVPLAFDGVSPQLIGLFVHGGYGAGFAIMGYGIYRFSQSNIAATLFFLPCFLALLHWDMRSESERRWEDSVAFGMQGRLAQMIKPGDVVLSDGRVPQFAWYGLRTANYSSPTQAIGIVFSREKTFELLQRAQHIKSTVTPEVALSAPSSAVAETTPEGGVFDFTLPPAKKFSSLCKDPELDWIIARVRSENAQYKALPYFQYIPAESGFPPLWLYSCADARRASL